LKGANCMLHYDINNINNNCQSLLHVYFIADPQYGAPRMQ
jgi:hypothetical protein